MKNPILGTATLAAISIASTSFAGQPMSDGKKIIHEPIATESEWVVNLRSSYTFESDFSRGKQHGANGDSFFKGGRDLVQVLRRDRNLNQL